MSQQIGAFHALYVGAFARFFLFARVGNDMCVYKKAYFLLKSTVRVLKNMQCTLETDGQTRQGSIIQAYIVVR
jgi:hypothetical protein